MLDLDTVKHNIEQWIMDFVEVPNTALGGWPPCPYARQARLNNNYEIRIGRDPYHDLVDIAIHGLGDKKVIILAYDPEEFNHNDFSYKLKLANETWLLRNDILALEDHPADPEIVNGISMNQGTYALSLVQGLSDLNEKAQLVAKKGFYDTWPEEYLQLLFKHRKDPRAT
jgi:hypothetical protein